MSGVSPFEDGFKIKILNEALKGERSVGDIAAEGGIAGQTLRTWLEEHYTEFPEDERRHLQLRVPKSEKPPADDDDDNEARDDMANPGDEPVNKVDPETKAKIMARVYAAEKAKAAGEPYERKKAIADEYGLHAATISYWLKDADPTRETKSRPDDPRRKLVFRDLKEGVLTKAEIMKKHEIGASTWHRWKVQFDKMKADRREQMKHARSVKADKMQNDPEFRARYGANLSAAHARRRGEAQLELPEPTSQTMLSRPEPPISQSYPPPSVRVAVGIARYEQGPPPSAQQLPSDFIQESFKEAVEERNTLRNMLKIVQRERDEFEQQVIAYKRRYGVMQ